MTKVLNVFDKYEGKGWGMKRLVNSCLDGEIDLPYYIFHSRDDLSLFIPKGKLVDENVQVVLDSFSKYIALKLKGLEITDEQKRIFAYFYKSEIANKNEKWTLLLTKNNNHLNAISSLEESGLIQKHPISDEIYSVYVVDRIFFQKNYYHELEKIFGSKFNEVKQEEKDVLNAIYLHKNYSLKDKISANLIGNFLFYKTYDSNFDLKLYDAFKRKIRRLFNNLEDTGFLNPVKSEYGKGRTINYEFNNNLRNTWTLFP